MAYDWSQVYEQQAIAPTGNQGEMQILERRSQLEAQQKQRDFENQLELLRQSADYNNATTKKRIEMEARLFAMQKQFLPTEMTADLLGIPQNKPIESESASYKNIGERDNNIFGKMGAGAGATSGALNPAIMSKFNGVLGGGMNTLGTAIRQNPLTDKIGTGGANILSKAMKNPSKSVLNKLLQGGAKGLALGTGGLEAGTTLLGSGLSKAGLGLAGKSLGKVGGAIAGGVPGFLIGTAIGKIIEQLLDGNDEDKARAEYLINQYK